MPCASTLPDVDFVKSDGFLTISVKIVDFGEKREKVTVLSGTGFKGQTRSPRVPKSTKIGPGPTFSRKPDFSPKSVDFVQKPTFSV